MSDAHREQLVYTETDDGYLLEGAVFTPADGGNQQLPIVWIHGFTGRFYERHTVAIGRRLAARGHVFLTGNNRGHHLGANIVNLRGGPDLRGGGWWENIADCVHDYPAWIRFACELGFERVVLAGHSLGALKAVYYMGTCEDERVAALISASGPLRTWQRFRNDPDRLDLAKRMVSEGRGAALLPDDGTPWSTSAQTHLWRAQLDMDVYGIERRDPPLAAVTCPLAIVLGSEEPEIATEADLPTVVANARAAASTHTIYVQGADHLYRGHELEVADALADWIAQLPR